MNARDMERDITTAGYGQNLGGGELQGVFRDLGED